MSRFVLAFAAVGFLLAGLLGGVTAADAEVVITVNKSTQRLSVVVDGIQEHEWPVSTARWGYRTPNGTYRPQRLARKWYSRKYDMSPMPYSIFFHGGYAIHGSYEISRLGRPASHGCIRLLPKHAAVLFRIVRANRGDTKIVVTGSRPAYRAVERRSRTETRVRRRARAEERWRGADFEDVFGPPRSTYRRRAPYPTWDDMLNQNNPGQRAFRRWWYSR